MRRNRKPRSTNAMLKIGASLVEAHTVAGLSRMVGKSRDTILRYEKLGIFPPAPILYGSIRYYPLELCRRLVPLVRRIPTNRKVDANLIVEINKAFKEEKEKLCLRQVNPQQTDPLP